MAKILIIEDEKAIRNVLSNIVIEEDKNHEVDTAENGLDGFEMLTQNTYDLVLCDIKMPKMDGIELLEKAIATQPELPIVMISGHGDLDTAVESIKKGAFDYISKPPDLNRLLHTIRNGLDRKSLMVQNKALKKKVSKKYKMVGNSPALQKILEMIERVAPTDARVLIIGANGSGKELIAHAIHQKSERSNAPMIEVNCAAIPSELIESELFGHEKGAFDYISKPPDLNRLLHTIRIGLDRNNLVVQNKVLRKKVSKKYEMVGNSPELQKIHEMIERVAPTDARVLIIGANGSGKELIAHAIHQKSERSNAPMIEVNCAAIPSELIESELFGHEKGAFTSAIKQRKGKFETANGGTLFLDEVGDMSLKAQAKVLRALQEHKISRVGSDKEIKVNVRVLAATNKDLQHEIKEGRFREDLYHRLGVILINNPSLDERKDDIPILIEHFNSEICKEHGIAKKSFTDDALKVLMAYNWSGNIRELRNVIERLIILSSDTIDKETIKSFSGK